MSIDHVNPYDVLAMNGASAALAVSDIPFPTQVGAVRIGKLEGRFVVNPAEADLPESELDLIVAGTDDAILMVEAGANEATEAEILDALEIAHEEIKKLCAAQRELRRAVRQEKIEVEPPAVDQGLYEQIQASHGAELDAATQVEDKLERQDATKAVEEAVLRSTPLPRGRRRRCRATAGSSPRSTSSRKTSSAAGSRSTSAAPTVARRTRSARSAAEVGIAPRTHGSALFTRGQTQVFSVTPSARAAKSSASTRSGSRRPSATCTTTTSRPSRSGRPASCAGRSAATSATARSPSGRCSDDPAEEEFPYTIRVVSEMLESNGSSSMASVCGSTLSLMDAGVKIKKPVAGIAMGLIKEGDDYIVLSDIAGVEDHLGDMDFKIAGTREASPRSRWTSRSRASRSRS